VHHVCAGGQEAHLHAVPGVQQGRDWTRAGVCIASGLCALWRRVHGRAAVVREICMAGWSGVRSQAERCHPM